jgi:hypothetical protein
VHDLVAREAAETIRGNVKRSPLEGLKGRAASSAGKDNLAAGQNCMAIDRETHARTLSARLHRRTESIYTFSALGWPIVSRNVWRFGAARAVAVYADCRDHE